MAQCIGKIDRFAIFFHAKDAKDEQRAQRNEQNPYFRHYHQKVKK
jgi:hypothetical protein